MESCLLVRRPLGAPRQVILGGCLVDIGLEGLLSEEEKLGCENCGGTWCGRLFLERERVDILGP